MSEIYVVISRYAGDCEVVGIFSSIEKAKAFIDQATLGPFEVEVHGLDPLPGHESESRRVL